MQTKFNVGDHVWIQAKIIGIVVNGKGDVSYTIRPTVASIPASPWIHPEMEICGDEMAEEEKNAFTQEADDE